MIKRVLIEPGRSLVAEAGYTVYTVGQIKKTPNRLYAFVDGGMADNIRPALYQAEYDALKTIRALNGNSYEHIDEVFTKFSKETDEKDSKINGLNEQLSTLRVERDKFSKELDAANSKLEELNSYKEGIENAKKEEIFSKFSTHLSEETLNKYKEKSKDYSVEQLEKELAYEFCLSTPSLFTDDPLENGFVPKDEQPATGIEAILRKNSEK
jgi:predicted mannosyl-3-phosphoglycerate phosphatase (HAD superfamily)